MTQREGERGGLLSLYAWVPKVDPDLAITHTTDEVKLKTAQGMYVCTVVVILGPDGPKCP